MPTETLQEINPDSILANEENPRLIFREEEMSQLMDSIQEVGIRVPLSVYEDGGKFVLIDGERRWRCSRKLNLKLVPAIVYPKPGRLENLLMMFNIHNVRKDWDIMPMALKLQDVKELLKKEGKDDRPKALSAITGVPLVTVNRAFELLDLPDKYRTMLLDEVAKPRHLQKVTPDLFIEINKSYRVVRNYTPEVLVDTPKEVYVDVMVNKYVDDVITNVVHFRDMQKIARAEKAGISQEIAVAAISKLIKNPKFSIAKAYEETVELAYLQRDFSTKLENILDKIWDLEPETISSEIKDKLIALRRQIDRLVN